MLGQEGSRGADALEMHEADGTQPQPKGQFCVRVEHDFVQAC